MKKRITISYLLIIFIVSFHHSLLAQVGIHFTFANPNITSNGSDSFLEFDVMAEATGNSQFKLAQVYIDYNTAGFGTNIVGSGNVTITNGTLLLDTFQGTPPNFGAGSYTPSANDNTSSKIAIQNTFNYSTFGTYTGMGYELSNTLGTTPRQYVHVAIKILDPNASAVLSFDSTVSQFELQQYYYTTTGADDQTNYTPVTTGDWLVLPLPVELVSFSALPKESNVELKWQTATEINNYGFDLERRLRGDDETWKKIGFVAGAGNSNSLKQYSYIDKNPVGGSQFVYRLKQIDNDGQYEYSDEVEIEIVPATYELSQNYPNPFNPVTKIKFSLIQNGRVKIKIYNTLGEEVREIINKEYEFGYHEVEFNSMGLASGVYLYRIEAGDFVDVKKMMLLK